MPLGASRLNFLAKRFAADEVVAEQRSAIDGSAIGNAQIDTAQSKFNGSSGLFDGTGDAVLLNTPILPATDDWTVEMWVYPTSIGAIDYFFTQYSAGTSGRTTMYMNASGQVGLFINGGPSFTSTGTLSASTWQHIAWVRNGSSFKIYIDGTEDGSGTGSPSVQQIDSVLGALNNTGSDGFIGNIDEVRISSTARYTAGFTPSTTPFTNDNSNTLMLMHMDGTDASTVFIDDNGERLPIGLTAISGADIDTSQNVFGGTSLDTRGASSGDYLKIDKIPAIGTGDYTIEGRVRIANLSSFNGIFQLTPNSSTGLSGTYTGGIAFQLRTSTGQWRYIANATWQETTGLTVSANTWYHFALVRSGTSATLYIDGTSVKTSTDSTDYSSDWYGAIGGIVNTSNTNDGHIDEFRVSNTARYTSNFTPDTSAFANDSNTLLLVHMDGENNSNEFFDDNGKRVPVNIGEVFGGEIDTAQSKFGGSSWYQSAQYYGFIARDEGPFDTIGTGEFTVEAFVRKDTDITGNQYVFNGNSGQCLYYDDTNNRFEYATGTGETLRITGTTAISNNTWYHVALVRDSAGDVKLYVDGSQEGSAYSDSGDWSSNTEYTFGVDRGGTKSWRGHIDEIRVSNTARYTAGFSAPTTAFKNDANTIALFHLNGTDGATRILDDN